MADNKSIGVIGGGAWGTALAQIQAAGGKDTIIWARETEVVQDINDNHKNDTYLPGIPLSENLQASVDIEEASMQDVILLVTPAQHMRATLEAMKPHLYHMPPLVICAKGIELESGKLLSRIAAEILPKDYPIAVMTGPTFADEIASGQPSAVTIAAETEDKAKLLQEALGLKYFRPYTSDDMVGAQLGGSIKNVIAIASGIVTGRKLGDSARAALITRGIAEIARLCVGMGGKRETLLGMCGVGDLMLTASSMRSRNFSLGVALGEGKSLDEILKNRNSVTEGIHTAKAALVLASRNAVDMPITEAVNKCLNEGLSIDQAIEEMLNRPFKY